MMMMLLASLSSFKQKLWVWFCRLIQKSFLSKDAKSEFSTTLTKQGHTFSTPCLLSVCYLAIYLPIHHKPKGLLQDGWHVSQLPHGELNHSLSANRSADKLQLSREYHWGFHRHHGALTMSCAWRQSTSLLPYRLSSLNYRRHTEESILMRGAVL